tara:strand:- start:1381 stop:2211 length:831 start_codon:yes stop_codon:yes gene_type:complete
VGKLTIGTCVHDDFQGLYFTLQSIRLHHKDVLDRLEFVVINNNPKSPEGKEVRKLIDWIKEPITYVEFDAFSATSLRDKIFGLANTEYVMVLDCHVLLESGSLKKLLDFYDAGKDNGNLLQGPLIYDDMENISTHFDLNKWGADMWGVWETDKRGRDPNSKAFEIPAQGLGLFTCRKDSWLGFNEKFRGFGGEEGYIHEKYRNAGRKAVCLPFLRWLHRFGRPQGVTYGPTIEDRFRNYMIGFHEIGKDTNEIVDRFKGRVTKEHIQAVKKELKIE